MIEAKDLGEVIQVGMLHNQVPLGEVHSIVEICDGDLHSPVLLVIELDVPMDTDWAHMAGAL